MVAPLRPPCVQARGGWVHARQDVGLGDDPHRQLAGASWHPVRGGGCAAVEHRPDQVWAVQRLCQEEGQGAGAQHHHHLGLHREGMCVLLAVGVLFPTLNNKVHICDVYGSVTVLHSFPTEPLGMWKLCLPPGAFAPVY